MRIMCQRNEVRLCTLLVGTLQTLWAVLPMIGGDFRLRRVLDRHDDEWLYFMLLCGVLLIVTSGMRWRSGRHIALVMSAAMWAGLTHLWVKYMVVNGGTIVSPVLISTPIFLLFCILLFANDVAQKPRTEGGGDD